MQILYRHSLVAHRPSWTHAPSSCSHQLRLNLAIRSSIVDRLDAVIPPFVLFLFTFTAQKHNLLFCAKPQEGIFKTGIISYAQTQTWLSAGFPMSIRRTTPSTRLLMGRIHFHQPEIMNKLFFFIRSGIYASDPSCKSSSCKFILQATKKILQSVSIHENVPYPSEYASNHSTD